MTHSRAIAVLVSDGQKLYFKALAEGVDFRQIYDDSSVDALGLAMLHGDVCWLRSPHGDLEKLMNKIILSRSGTHAAAT